MKRFLTILLTCCIALTANTIALASNDVKIKVNGTPLRDAQAVLKDGSTLLPVRSVSTALGGEVTWDNATKTASISKDGTEVAITIGQKNISVNNKTKAISTPAQVINGRTYVPLRALGEALECDITWVNETKTVEISQVDPSEYKAWYEVGEDGLLYIHTNINSDKWGGCSFVCKYISDGNHYTWNDMTGNGGTVSYQTYSSVSYYDIGKTIKRTEVYIFKGADSLKTFGNLLDSNSENWNKSVAAMGDLLVGKFTLSNKIQIETLDIPVHLTDFNVTYDRLNQKETYTAYTEEELPAIGEYGVVCLPNGNKNDSEGSSLIKSDGFLTSTRSMNKLAKPGSAAKIYLTYAYMTMDAKGNITCHKAESNMLDYRFPY